MAPFFDLIKSPTLWVGLSLGILMTVPLAVVASIMMTRRVRRLETRARSAERLAELGTLTGGLAHEIKNPLSTIGLNSQLLSEDLDDLADLSRRRGREQDTSEIDRIRRRFGTVTREADRLKNILEDFLRFAGRIKLERLDTDLNATVDELTDFFQPQADAGGVHLRTELAASPATLPLDAALFKQALLNLMINAVQIMRDTRQTADTPTGGCDELIIRTARRKIDGTDHLLIDIIDTGPGIAADRLDKIFQPYFTTRQGGTGLGLPTTRRIIEEHGGHITVDTDLGRGTNFRITLPVSQAIIHPPADPDS